MSSPHDGAWLEGSGLPTAFASWCRNSIQGAEVRMQIIWQQDAGSLILPRQRSRFKLAYDTKAAAGVSWMGCVLGGLSVCTTWASAKVAWECWRLQETASSIVHYFPLLFLPSRHTTIYTQIIIQVFLLAVGCDWLYGPNMAESDWLTAREGRELWKGRPRFKAGMQKIIGVLFHMAQVDIMNCWHHMTSMQLASN